MGRLELIIETDSVSIYSPKYDGEELSEFEKFLSANDSHTQPQLRSFFDSIIATIEKIQECGARENLFRREGGNVKAIPLLVSLQHKNQNIGKVRLYCLRLSDRLLIIGNGGVTKERRYENDPIHLSYVNDLRVIDKHVKRLARQAGTDCDDFEALKLIVECIYI